MNTGLQIALALIVPIGWGLLSAWLFDLFRARRRKRPCPPRDAEARD